MEKLKNAILICSCLVVILIVGNIWFLHKFYKGAKSQYIERIENCVRRADILLGIKLVQSNFQYAKNEKMTISFAIAGDIGGEEWFNDPELDKRLTEDVMATLYFQDLENGSLKRKNLLILDSIFRQELRMDNMNPQRAFILPSDSILHDTKGLWKIDFSIFRGKVHLYNIYISSFRKEILSEMLGIIGTYASSLIILTCLIWYLFWCFRRFRTIEQMKDDFTHNMTHELKTPVAVAYSAADSMLRYYNQSDEERNRKFLHIIMQRLNFLSGMIENILSMSMERLKTMKLNIESVDIRPLVDEIVGMMEMKAEKPVTFNIDISEPLSIMTDPLHFGNIISNLIDNAVKYSGKSVRIDIKADSTSITITDNGVGIDKDYLPYIFDKFYRVTSGDLYEIGGYGLGLYYVKQIVDLQGWNIDVISRPGQGTTFIIKFKGNEKR